MALVCPKCGGAFERHVKCPACSVRLSFDVAEQSQKAAGNSTGRDWLQAPLGRLMGGILLAQGLVLGLRLCFDATYLAAGNENSNPIWSTLFGLVLLQVLQAVCLLVAGAMVGAGQRRGLLLGALVGLVNGTIHLVIQQAGGTDVSLVLVYGQALLHVFFGFLGGLIGSAVWKPLPAVETAKPPAEKKQLPRRAKAMGHFSGPISWPRVVLGSAVAVAGTLSATMILQFVLNVGEGELRISSNLQSCLVTWEIAAIAVFLGAGFAGFNTFNGLKQGLCVGTLSATCLVFLEFANHQNVVLERVLFLVFFVLSISLFGGWFSCKMFPPISKPRRRLQSMI